jgi:hypothetical protein
MIDRVGLDLLQQVVWTRRRGGERGRELGGVGVLDIRIDIVCNLQRARYTCMLAHRMRSW